LDVDCIIYSYAAYVYEVVVGDTMYIASNAETFLFINGL
jgi:hypothetical protein